ncbi:MAG TPA: hypothetical protein VF753_04830 [Terriglobales bacterium]
MGGVVFSPGTSSLSRYGAGVAVGNGAPIPAGTWFTGGGFTVTNGTQTVTCTAGLCVSDGVNVLATAAQTVIALGA